MKVLLVNGSPHQNGCTATALKEIEETLNKQGIDTENFWIGTKPVAGCIGCGSCLKTGKCFIEDKVNEFLEKVPKIDGFVFGTLGAAVVSCRRGGATATLDEINKYFGISNMPIVSSQYWNMVHGNTPEEVKKDEEGMQTMRTLANNMAWLLKSIEAGRKAGIELPKREEIISTNFIR